MYKPSKKIRNHLSKYNTFFLFLLTCSFLIPGIAIALDIQTINNINTSSNSLAYSGNIENDSSSNQCAIALWAERSSITPVDCPESPWKTQHQQLIKNLIEQNQIETALEVSQIGQNVDLRDFSTQLEIQSPAHYSSNSSPNVERIKHIAKLHNATIVQYTIIYNKVIINGKKRNQESELITWVIKPNGDIAMRQINLQSRRCKERFSFANLINQHINCLYKQDSGLKSAKTKGISVETPKSDNTLQELHQILIEPIAKLLPKNPEERVIFIPQGDLFLVAFAGLRDNQGKYLIEKHTISTAPSIQILDLLYQRQIKRKLSTSLLKQNIKGDELLIVGNPATAALSPKPGEKPAELSPLPGTEEEAKNIAKIFKTQAILGKAATETVIVQKMPQAKIIHLATHVVQLNNADVIALAASNQDDGWLSAEEIQKLHLQADLVVLSSGKTALGTITSDGVIGLSRAFFVAGAYSFIGSVWEANDRGTAFLMTKFYENLSKKPDKSKALRQAMLETMKKYPNPQDWAGFVSIGL
ncbi:CHAT domain-containing protein [Calothrix sp. 336/3]|uniref:CHAT domain-containing protein n=1 Tax=Calothrix sp. 336/3 TaxID=1337936 RepID=UPI00069BCA6C|nr:CHAT domain-containing protein [Calothrix sp. 336/3]